MPLHLNPEQRILKVSSLQNISIKFLLWLGGWGRGVGRNLPALDSFLKLL